MAGTPFSVGLQAGALLVVILFVIHKILVSLTPANKRINQPTPSIPPAAVISSKPKNNRTHIVVVGGSGMLGSALTSQLVQQFSDSYKIRVVDIYKGSIPNVEYEVASVGDEDALTKAFKDADAVYHLAAVLEYNNLPWAFQVNVIGTRHVVNACFRAGVSRLVYTSSISVVFGQSKSVSGDERTLTYSPTQLTPYSTTKAIAEIMVLKANGQNGLKTCAIRPPVLYGPNDILIKTIMNPNIPIVNGNVPQSWMHVDNAAHWHVRAMTAMEKDNSPVPGNFYFVSDGTYNALKFVRDVAKVAGVRPAFRFPRLLLYLIAFFVEALYLYGGGFFTNSLFMVNLPIVRMANMPFEVVTEKAEKEIGIGNLPLPTFQQAIAAYVSASKQGNESRKNK